MSTYLLSQSQINKLKNLNKERNKTQQFLYDRLVHNHEIQDLIRELTEEE